MNGSPFRSLALAQKKTEETLEQLREQIAQAIAVIATEAKKLDPEQAITAWMDGLKEIASGMGFSPDVARRLIEEINYAYDEADGDPRLSTIVEILRRHGP